MTRKKYDYEKCQVYVKEVGIKSQQILRSNLSSANTLFSRLKCFRQQKEIFDFKPLKLPKNQRYSGVYRAYKMRKLTKNGFTIKSGIQTTYHKNGYVF